MAVYMPHLEEATSSKGGYFVPDELASEVNRLIRDSGCVESMARKWPMKGRVLTVRKFATGVDGYWVDAMAVKEKDAPTFEAIDLIARKMAVIVPFEDQLIEDADTDLAAMVKEDVTGAFIEALDRTYLGYEATSPFASSWSGNVPAANIVPYGTGVDLAEDINQAISRLEVNGFEATGMVAHPRVKAILRGLRDLNNQPIFSENLNTCNWQERFCVYGVPICFTRQVAPTGSPLTTEILMAYTPYIYVGIRTGLQVAKSNEATLTWAGSPADSVNLFEQDMTAFRFVMRRAFEIKDNNALSKITGVPMA